MATTDQPQVACIFCRIARGEIPTVFVVEMESVVAFRDLHPQAPTHILVIPRKHIASLNDLGPDDVRLAGELLAVAAEVADVVGIAESGYRVFTNSGADAGQSVFHLHLHVVGGRQLGIGVL